jgi:hypothetical protein
MLELTGRKECVTNLHDITEILLKVALKTINHTYIRIVNPFSTLHVNKLNVGNTIEANVIFWCTSLDITRSC